MSRENSFRIAAEYLPKQIYIYKHSINPKYMKQRIIYHFKTYTWLGTFRHNCIRSQLNNEGGGELHKIKRSWNKTVITKEIIWGWTNILWSHSSLRLFYDMKVTRTKYLYWVVRRVTWLCVIFWRHHRMRENNHAHSTAVAVYSRPL